MTRGSQTNGRMHVTVAGACDRLESFSVTQSINHMDQQATTPAKPTKPADTNAPKKETHTMMYHPLALRPVCLLGGFDNEQHDKPIQG